ncbi:MAG: hypothetical protein ACYCYO_15975 [Bacilli bacterium]
MHIERVSQDIALHILVNPAQEIVERLDSICGTPQDLEQGGNFVMVLQNAVKTLKVNNV